MPLDDHEREKLDERTKMFDKRIDEVRDEARNAGAKAGGALGLGGFLLTIAKDWWQT